MAYTKQTWEIGETLSASKFNNLEAGVGTDLFLVTFDYDCSTNTLSCDSSFSEAESAILAGIPVLCNVRRFNISDEEFTKTIGGTYLVLYNGTNHIFEIEVPYNQFYWYSTGISFNDPYNLPV